MDFQAMRAEIDRQYYAALAALDTLQKYVASPNGTKHTRGFRGVPGQIVAVLTDTPMTVKEIRELTGLASTELCTNLYHLARSNKINRIEGETLSYTLKAEELPQERNAS